MLVSPPLQGVDMNRFQTTCGTIVLLLLVGTAAMVAGQDRQEREREELRIQQREERSDAAAISGLKERVSRTEEDVKSLKTALSNLREELKSTTATANNNRDEVTGLIAFGKWIMGGLLFVAGVVVTQLVSNFMNRRKDRHSGAMAARRGS